MIRCATLLFLLTFGSYAITFAQEPDTLSSSKNIAEARRLTQIGNQNRADVYFDSARWLLRDAMEPFRVREFWDRYFFCANQIAYLYHHVHRYNDSKVFLDSLQHIFGDKITPELKSSIFYYGAHAYANLQSSNFLEAQSWFSRVNALMEQSPHTTPQNRIWASYFQGVLYYRLGHNSQALHFMDKTERLGNEAGDNTYLGQVYNIKGIISRRIGDYQKAQEYYQASYEVEKSLRPKVQLTPILNNLSSLHHSLGNDSLSFYYVDDALKTLRDYTPDYYTVESALRNTKATTLIDLDRHKEAEVLIRKNLERELSKFGEYGIYSVASMLNLALVLQEDDDFEKAQSYYDESLRIIKSVYGDQNPKLADVYRLIGNNYVKQDKYDEAMEMMQTGISLLVPGFDAFKDVNPPLDGTILDKLHLLKILKDKAETHFAKFSNTSEALDLTAAVTTNETAIQLLNDIRGNLYYGESKQVLSSLMKPLFEQSIRLSAAALDLNSNDNAARNRLFQATEQSKSYVLSSALQESAREGTNAIPDSLWEQQEQLFLQITINETRLNDLLVGANPDSAKVSELQATLLQSRETYEAFRAELEDSYPTYSNARFGSGDLDLELIQRKLSGNALIVEYFAGEDLYALAISKGEVKLLNLGNYEEISKKIRSFVDFGPRAEAAMYQERAHAVYQVIVEPVLNGNTDRSILFIPDGIIGSVPMDALVVKKVPNPTFQNLDYGIHHYTTNQHYLASLSAPKGQDAEASFIGYAPDFEGEKSSLLATRSGTDSIRQMNLVRLPFAASEVQTVSELLNGTAVIGKDASEGHFKRVAGSYNYLHVASHSLVDNQRPLFSKLVFARNEKDSLNDGLLHAYELYGMKLNSELVALSACNTGVGQYRSGEGVISLARGFIFAGASSVLMSLWEVADQSTSEIITSFYREIDKGRTKAEALRNAKLSYLSAADEITANPYYWAGFTHLGSDEETSSNYWVILIGGMLLVIVVISRRRSQKIQ